MKHVERPNVKDVKDVKDVNLTLFCSCPWCFAALQIKSHTTPATMSGADLHHADLRRPEGMDQKIYDNLCKEYKRVSQNLHVAEGRANTSARTLARNQQL